MKVLSMFLLVSMAAVAQELPLGTPQSGCYALRKYQVARSEKVQPLSPPRVTTCTPASKFRVKYLPETVREREVRKAGCPECEPVQKPGTSKTDGGAPDRK